jgi:putative drug exporter of the RND superfamily
VGGPSAIQTDIEAINTSDLLRVMAFTIVGILIVTGLMLHSILAPLYMVATVLFNYGATLGISNWLFLDVLNQGAILYTFPTFVFVVLVAVSSDYNIFLVTRIKEENIRLPFKEGLSRAVANTGAVITACGVILAGTFATLGASSLQLVSQIGIAIAIGVIFDTFLVRSMMIPSIANLVGKWNWWPFGLPRRPENEETSDR